MKELMNRIWKKEEGFSLIELIIVIAILAIIAAIAVPALIENINDSRRTTDISNAKMIADATAIAIANNPDWGEDFTEQEFIVVASPGTDVSDNVINEAISTLGKVPQIAFKPGTYDSFSVEVASGAVIVTTTVDDIALFPEPEDDYTVWD